MEHGSRRIHALLCFEVGGKSFSSFLASTVTVGSLGRCKGTSGVVWSGVVCCGLMPWHVRACTVKYGMTLYSTVQPSI